MHGREYVIHITTAADIRFVGHVIFLARASISGAERLYNKLYKTIYSLDFNPEGYPRYFTSKSAKTELRYCFCPKYHRIVYDVVGDNVYVHDVQDCRQHPNRSLV